MRFSRWFIAGVCPCDSYSGFSTTRKNSLSSSGSGFENVLLVVSPIESMLSSTSEGNALRSSP